MIPHHPLYLSAVQPEHIHPAMRNDSSWMATCHSGAPSSNITPDVWQFCQSAISRRPASGSPANSVSSVWRSLCPPEPSPAVPPDTLHWCSLKETQECTCVSVWGLGVLCWATRCAVTRNNWLTTNSRLASGLVCLGSVQNHLRADIHRRSAELHGSSQRGGDAHAHRSYIWGAI